MNRLLPLWFILFAFPALLAQSPTFEGSWSGTLQLPSLELPLVWHVKTTQGKHTATMDSPAQGVKGIPMAQTQVKADSLFIGSPPHGIHFKGTLIRPDSISGQFSQAGTIMPLSLVRDEHSAPHRLQTPKPPFPYESSDHLIPAKSGIQLGATLTKPLGKGPFPALVLLSGSGPQNRNGTLMEHEFFWVLADHLSRKGIAVLRFDDRGMGNSTGNYAQATTYNFAEDAQTTLTWLRQQEGIDPQKTGLLGHSEGGLAAMIAAPTSEPDFIILMASPGIRGDRLILNQQQALFNAQNIPEAQSKPARELNETLFALALEAKSMEEFASKRATFQKEAPIFQFLTPHQKQAIAAQLSGPWIFDYLRLDPKTYLHQIACPVLALNGDLDLQVDATTNMEAIAQGLEQGKRPPFEKTIYPGLNHLFQTATTGLPIEYGQITETMAPKVLADIVDWIKGI
jgi:pimeloyl-ACP methyl ester carboxylesterase